MYLHPEELVITPLVHDSRGFPVLRWHYDLSAYGRQHFDKAAQELKDDWITGSVRAAITVGAVVFLGLVVLAFLTSNQALLWAYLHLPAALWVLGVTAAYLHPLLFYGAENPYPLRYVIELVEVLDPTSATVQRIDVVLGCNRLEPPARHAQPGTLAPLHLLDPFELHDAGDGYKNLFAIVAADGNTPRYNVRTAVWTEGSLENPVANDPLQQLHALLNHALYDTRNTWLRPTQAPRPILPST